MLAANRASGILAQLELAEAHGQRIEQEQAAHQGIAATENQLDRLHRLDRSDDARKHAQNSTFGARGYQSWRGRFGIQAAVTRAAGIPEYGGLPLKSEDRAIHIGFAQ